jgi:mannose-6-phosphate isomerase-like protein (cupin superfamily)
MYNTKVNIGHQPDQILMYEMHVHFKGRNIKVEIPFVYFDISNPFWKDDNFFAEHNIFSEMESNI